MRLPRERRLRRQEDFGRLRAHGARVDCGPFVLNAGPTGLVGQLARLGIVAAKKHLPRAVDRNRAKRLMREAFRACPNLFPSGWDIAVVVRRSVLTRGLPALVESLRSGAAKAKALRPSTDA